MWIVATDEPYENWIEVFNTKEEAQQYFIERIREQKETEEYIDLGLLTKRYKIYIAQVKEWSIFRL